MKNLFLEMTYRGGRPVIGYLYLARSGEKAASTREMAPGLVVDFAADGQPIGIEILHPSLTKRDQVNALLRELRQEPVPDDELAPLGAK
ncbi:MAG: DUF2283 domain-containing protein [Phycisphaerae bacterium]|nr:DUF2283 domain-containing protein [Phycisphaerae bacterium]